jgi:serine/threonine protein kinase
MGFKTWHRFASHEKIVKVEVLRKTKQFGPEGFAALGYPEKFKMLFDKKQASLLAVGKYSKVYEHKGLAYKYVKIKTRSNEDHSNLRINLKELGCFHGLSHPNVMKPLRSQLVMEHGRITRVIHEMKLASGTLDDELPHIRSLNDIQHLLGQVAQALYYLHSRGMVHGDVKPANVLIFGPEKVVQLTDFTLTTHYHKGTGVSLGTLYWRAPECILQKTYTQHSDIWAFGVLLLDLLTGLHYFGNAKDDAELLELVTDLLTRKTAIPFHLRDRSPHFEDLVYRILREDPLQRLGFDQIVQHPFFATNIYYAPMGMRVDWFERDVQNLCEIICTSLVVESVGFDKFNVTEMCRRFLGFIWKNHWFNDAEFQSEMFHVVQLSECNILAI